MTSSTVFRYDVHSNNCQSVVLQFLPSNVRTHPKWYEQFYYKFMHHLFTNQTKQKLNKIVF